MANLTISVDEHLIRAARIKAIQEGTSLSAKVREYLSTYALAVGQPGGGATQAFVMPIFDGGSGPCANVDVKSNRAMLDAAEGVAPPADPAA